MSKFYYDLTSDNYQDEWTLSRLADELHLQLCKNKKYQEQAIDKIYRIPLWRPSPPFVIHVSDLSEKIKHELYKLRNEDEKIFSIFIKESAGRFFENLNFEYYHLRVKKYLRVRFEP